MSDQTPQFLKQIQTEYTSKIAHTFIVAGNIFDYIDNSGHPETPVEAMYSFADDGFAKRNKEKGIDRGIQDSKSSNSIIKAVATYDIANGLKFASTQSHTAWVDIMTKFYGAKEIEDWRPDWQAPVSTDAFFWVMNKWHEASKSIYQENRENVGKGGSRTELLLYILFPNADALFPNGQIAQLSGDRQAIVTMRNWAKDEKLGARNIFILLSRHVTDINESLRGASSGIVSMSIAKPNITDRKEWLGNFSKNIRAMAATKENGHLSLGGNLIKDVNYHPDFNEHQFAVQSAGMSRKQLYDVIMKSWKDAVPVDFRQVRERKQKAIDDEYEGIVDFFEPEHGFEEVGGHEYLKRYFIRKVITPLRNGDAKLCSSGVLLTGPPGTGKTQLAKALAKEAQMNFMVGNLGKLFGGLVGETEQKTRKFFEAVESAAPVIVFIDEIDSVLSSGRTSTGDSGVAARVFNSVMQFLSDDSRKGKVVVVAASNRPDLLDAALIRSGRFDAKLPTLPPAKGDNIGRASILNALCMKHSIKFSKEMSSTVKDPHNGLGRLLMDDERVWTGAEIEVVVKEALDNAVFAGRTTKDGAAKHTIEIVDWNQAMDDILPNTEEVERMTKLALVFCDTLAYIPPEWKALAKDKRQLREDLGLNHSNS